MFEKYTLVCNCNQVLPSPNVFLTRHIICRILTGAAVGIGVPGFLVKHQRSLWGNHLNEGGHLAAKQRRTVYTCRSITHKHSFVMTPSICWPGLKKRRRKKSRKNMKNNAQRLVKQPGKVRTDVEKI